MVKGKKPKKADRRFWLKETFRAFLHSLLFLKLIYDNPQPVCSFALSSCQFFQFTGGRDALSWKLLLDLFFVELAQCGFAKYRDPTFCSGVSAPRYVVAARWICFSLLAVDAFFHDVVLVHWHGKRSVRSTFLRQLYRRCLWHTFEPVQLFRGNASQSSWWNPRSLPFHKCDNAATRRPSPKRWESLGPLSRSVHAKVVAFVVFKEGV